MSAASPSAEKVPADLQGSEEEESLVGTVARTLKEDTIEVEAGRKGEGRYTTHL